MNKACDNLLFILIDDDDINNIISYGVIQKECPTADTMAFRSPIAALKFLKTDFEIKCKEYERVILLLNLNMPLMSGWEFMAQFETLTDETKAWIKVYILSSSIDPRDVAKSRNNNFIAAFLEKPLTKDTLLTLLKKE